MLLVACGGQSGGEWARGGAAAPREAPPAPAAPASVRVPRRNVVVGDADAVAVELQFHGVGALFRGFFGDPELVSRLGVEIAPCIAGGLAVIEVGWSEKTRIGTITVVAEPEMIRCPPVIGDTVDLSPLEPIGRALARYRDGVSGRYDLRVASFRPGLKILHGMHHCAFWLGGQYPPDGTTWKRCAEFAGNEVCMDGDRREGVVALDLGPEHTAYVRACFDL